MDSQQIAGLNTKGKCYAQKTGILLPTVTLCLWVWTSAGVCAGKWVMYCTIGHTKCYQFSEYIGSSPLQRLTGDGNLFLELSEIIIAFSCLIVLQIFLLKDY